MASADLLRSTTLPHRLVTARHSITLGPNTQQLYVDVQQASREVDFAWSPDAIIEESTDSDVDSESLGEQPTLPPKGDIIAMLFTDIEKSTMMQKEFLRGYDFMQDRHDKCLEDAIYKFNGYVVNKVGDLYFAVFSSANEAIQAACMLQENLFNAVWPGYFTKSQAIHSKFAGAPGRLFNGIRVRVGVHIAECGADVNPYDGAPESMICKPNIVLSVDYQGNAVSMAERIMDMGAGGQILITGAVHKAAEEFLSSNESKFHITDHGVQKIKGLRDIQVFEVQPDSLSGRVFPELQPRKHERIQQIEDLTKRVQDTMVNIQRSELKKEAVRDTKSALDLIIAECKALQKLASMSSEHRNAFQGLIELNRNNELDGKRKVPRRRNRMKMQTRSVSLYAPTLHY